MFSGNKLLNKFIQQLIYTRKKPTATLQTDQNLYQIKRGSYGYYRSVLLSEHEKNITNILHLCKRFNYV